MHRGLIVAIVAGVLLALFPFTMDAIDAYYASTSSTNIESIVSSVSGGVNEPILLVWL